MGSNKGRLQSTHYKEILDILHATARTSGHTTSHVEDALRQILEIEPVNHRLGGLKWAMRLKEGHTLQTTGGWGPEHVEALTDISVMEGFLRSDFTERVRLYIMTFNVRGGFDNLVWSYEGSDQSMNSLQQASLMVRWLEHLEFGYSRRLLIAQDPYSECGP